MKMKRKLMEPARCFEMKAASRFANYFRDDCINDYLDKFRIYTMSHLSQHLRGTLGDGFRKRPAPSGMFKYLIENGNSFEKTTFDHLKTLEFPFFEFPGTVQDIFKDENYDKTKSLLSDSSQVDMIFHGVLRNYSNNTFGAPDLIMRGRAIRTLFPDLKDFVAEQLFYVVDVKASCLKRNDDGTLPNNFLYDGYKAQLAVYTLALKEMTNLASDKCFILGKNPDDTLGMALIDYSNGDGWVYEKLDKGIRWFNNLHENGRTWSIDPPSVPELRPNMLNMYDGSYRDIKEYLAKKQGEISLLEGIDNENRKQAFEKGIYSMADPRLDCDALGIKRGDSRYGLLTKILDFRRSAQDLHVPRDNNVGNWRERRRREAFVVAFKRSHYTLFGIGVRLDGDFKFLANLNGDEQGEMKMWEQFCKLTREAAVKTIVCWDPDLSHCFEKLSEKYKKCQETAIIDLAAVFCNPDTPVLVKDLYSYTKDDVVKRLYDLGLLSEYADKISVHIGEDGIDERSFDTVVTYVKTSCRILEKIITESLNAK